MMDSFSQFYQNMPLHINPTVVSVGSFSLGWYPLMYIMAFSVAYLLLGYRVKHDGQADQFQISNFKFQIIAWDFMFYAVLGVLIGGRLGYVLFYNLPYYLHNPLAVISPYDFAAGRWTGIYGMSYHGGLIGVVLVSVLFVRKYELNFWKFADFVVPVVPAGYFFGRIGNFLNLELYGRIADSPLSMQFPLWTGAGPYPRYPSQLFEAFFEGLVLFTILWTIRNKKKFDGFNLTVYVIGYAAARFGVEFFRQPDPQLNFVFYGLTMGQLLSLAMALVGIFIYTLRSRKFVNNN